MDDIDKKIDEIFANICNRTSLKMDLDFYFYYKRNRRYFDRMTLPPFELIEISKDKIINFTKIGKQVKIEDGWSEHLRIEQKEETDQKEIKRKLSQLQINVLELQKHKLKNKIFYVIIGAIAATALSEWKGILKFLLELLPK